MRWPFSTDDCIAIVPFVWVAFLSEHSRILESPVIGHANLWGHINQMILLSYIFCIAQEGSCICSCRFRHNSFCLHLQYSCSCSEWERDEFGFCPLLLFSSSGSSILSLFGAMLEAFRQSLLNMAMESQQALQQCRRLWSIKTESISTLRTLCIYLYSNKGTLAFLGLCRTWTSV